MKNRSLFQCFFGTSMCRRFALAAASLLSLGCGAVYAAPGILNSGFGTGGIVNTDVAGGNWDSATGMAVYASGPQAGKIVVVGYTDPTGAGGDVLVSRYNANGTLDSSFGTGGHVIIDVNSAGNADSANSVVLAADGSVFVVGFTSDDPDYGLADLDSLILKLDSTGALDTTFNGTGYVVQPLAVISNDEFRGVTLQSDGKVVAVGQATNDSTNDMTIVRYNTNGTLDTTFNNSGILFVNVTVEDFAEDVIIQSDGKIVVVGETHGLETPKGQATDMAMIRVNANGTLDTTFGKAGKVTTSFSLSGFDRGESLALNTDGTILVAGRTSSPNGAVIARYTSKGALDTKFGTKGITVTPLAPPPDDVDAFDYGSGGLFGSLALQGDGKILFCGYEFNGAKTQAVVLRYSALGISDSSFGTDGKVITLEGEYSDGVQAVISGGKIVVAGTTIDAGGDSNLLLMQYDGDVTLTTLAADTIGNTSALLHGEVTGDGSPTDVSFQWGLSATALTNTLSVAAPVTGTSLTPVSATLGFLKPGLKYYYRVAAGGAVGSTILSFTTTKTVGVSPVAVTLAAISVTPTSATLRGTIDAKSTNFTDVQFQWGTTLAYANTTVGSPASVNAAGVTNVSLNLSGLLPNTKYNFRIRGASSVGSSDGANLTFTTGNTAPIANADTAQVAPGATVTIPVLDNDSDPDGNALKIASFVAPLPTQGKVSIVNNKLVFVAAATFTGTSFTYVAGDAFKGVSTSTTVTVSPPLITVGSSATTVAAAGGAVSFTVTAPTGAAWLATKTDSWITLFPVTSSVGSGTVLVTVAANKVASRSASIKIGGVVVHTINQNAGPASSFAAAAFSGLVAPDAVINGKVGGSLTLASTALGAVTGKLVLGATPYALKGFLTDGDASSVEDRQFVAFIPRKIPLAPLRLQLTYNSSSESIGFGVNDGLTVNGLGSPVKVRGYRHTFAATTPTANAPTGFAAPTYTIELAPTWGVERGIPDGASYATLKVLNTGVATWGGKLADGTVLLGSASVWPTGEVNIFKAFYKNLGSVSGAVDIDAVAPRNTVTSSTEFPMSWIKPRDGQLAYPGAFGAEILDVDGAEWKVTTASVLGITTPTNNATVSFANGEIEQAAYFADGTDAGSVSDLTQIFTIGTVALKNKVTPDLSLLNNPGQVKITAIDSVKGTFKGTMTLSDPSKIALGAVPAGTATKRITPFEGVLIDDGASNQRGTGFGLLQTLVDSSDETATKTPKLSFRVTLTKN